VRIEIELRATIAHQNGPARVLTVSRDYTHSNLTVGQDGTDLVVRVRRPDSDLSGEPPLSAPGLLRDKEWHCVQVVIRRDRITVVADGRLVDAKTVGPRALERWDADYRVAIGDEPAGERGWVGELRQAEVDVAGRRTDLLARGFLDPGRGVFLRSRARGFIDGTPNDALPVSIARLLAFVPLGAALQWRFGRARTTLVALASIAGVLLVGKLFVAGRDPRLADALLAFCGGLIGCLIVAGIMARRSQRDLQRAP
jgi:hypothetical protein